VRSNYIQYIIGFILLLLAQVLVFKNIVLFSYGFCFIYLTYLLVLPVNINSIMGLFIGFVLGVLVDAFYDTGGIHALASVFFMFTREKWLNLITPQGGYDINSLPTIKMAGISWFTGYSFPLIFIHHAILFFVESYGFSYFWFTLSKAFLSTCFTFLVVVLAQQLLFKRSGQRA